MSIERDKFSPSSSESLLNEAYLQLAQTWSLWEEPLERAIDRITRAVYHSMAVRRVEVWLIDEGGDNLELLSLNDSESEAMGQHMSLRCADYPAYFTALANNRVIPASDGDFCRHPKLTDLGSMVSRIVFLGLDIPRPRSGPGRCIVTSLLSYCLGAIIPIRGPWTRYRISAG